MTTGRINQVACRAARAPRYHTRCSTERARPAAPPTERRTDTKHARTDGGPSPHARRAPNRAGCSTCVRSVRNGLGSHARPLSRESSRARRRNRRPRAPTSAPPPVGAQRVHSVPQSTRWPRAARSTLRSCDAGPSAHRTGKGLNPSNEAGAHRPSRRSKIKAAAARWAMLCRAIRTATQGSRRGRPLHALACTRRLRTVAKPLTQFQNALARARIAPDGTTRTRPPHVPKHRATRCRAPRASCCPLDIGRAGNRPRPPWLTARRLAPSGAGARTICHEMARANSRARARCRPATGFDSGASSPATAPPPVARLHSRCCTLGAPRRAHEEEKLCPPGRGVCVCARARACVSCGVPCVHRRHHTL